MEVDISAIERLANEFEHGAGSLAERTQRFSQKFPPELAKLRRQVYSQINLLPVPLNGSVALGLEAGYFAQPLKGWHFWISPTAYR
jgi:hypothetical protein